MFLNLRVGFAKVVGKVGFQLSKLGSGNATSFSGFLFLKIAGYEGLNKLARDLKIGSILITGTNGKTTTTTLIIKLLSKDIQIRKSFESNTINALTTAILNGKGEIGVFEYGIRNIEYGIPDTIQKAISPIGIVYTTISSEHTQVNGVKNDFKSYLKAKELLSKDMMNGVVIVNSDDPNTTYIASKKENDIKVNYFGIDADNISDIFSPQSKKCPSCGKDLSYSRRFLNHRGVYECSCGFKRRKPDVKLTDIKFGNEKWVLTIEGDLYNYPNKQNILFNAEINVPKIGIHNIYNILASVTAYATFSPKSENIEKTVAEVFDNLDMSFIPPGRFDVLNYKGKAVGLGQGDNGDAMKINALYMNPYINGSLEFIYTTPDEYEDDIFGDHFEVIKSINPKHIIVIPGRKSVKKAEEYYMEIKKEYPEAEFYPIEYDNLNERIDKIYELITKSEYENIIVTGCGEEQAMWEKIKRKITAAD